MGKKKIKTVGGRPVVAQKMSLRRVGDGLSSALEVEPLDMSIGDSIVLVVRGHVAGVNLVESDPKDPDNDDLDEVLVVHGGTITVADDTAELKEMLDAQAEQNKLLEERKKGIQRIPGTDGSEPADGDAGSETEPDE